MNRSRVILLAAWGLLAIGALVQVIRPSEVPGPDVQAQPSSGDEPLSSGQEQMAYNEAGADGDGPDGAGTAGSNAGGDGGYGEQPLNAGSAAAALLDDPSAWDEAGVVLAGEAYVATVTGQGVASMTEPAPGPVQHWFPSPTQFGGDRAFLILDQTSSDHYVKVSLPVMPNGQEGWIPRSEIEISRIEHRALIDLSDDTVTVWDGDQVIVQTRAVTGKRAAPTPVGVFFVRDIIAQDDPRGGFGPYILALSGFSEVLETFQGGLPALAIHGTDSPGQIGSERSSGCVRIPNELITVLAESVPLGTPVTVIA